MRIQESESENVKEKDNLNEIRQITFMSTVVNASQLTCVRYNCTWLYVTV